MEYLLDGYNVLAANGLATDESGRRRLRVRLLDRFAGKQVTVRVVYDHKGAAFPREERISPAVTEVFVHYADSYIVERVEGHANPRALTVVTDDRKDIVNRIRCLRPHLKSSREFFSFLSPRAGSPPAAPEKPESDSPENIARYRDLFGR
ncbi:MAG: NYN domain-containing protein [Candidatus Aureabacteria bacterium]|nr:NYN domain-containing protein [Candidatus Auribacterota bacterium]